MPPGDFLLCNEVLLSCHLFASHLSDDLFIADVGLDRRLSDEEDNNAHHQRDDSNPTNPHYPLLIGQQPCPGARKGYVDTIARGDSTDDCAQVEHPIGRQPNSLKPLVETLPNDNHIHEEDHHRDTPDHCHCSLQDIINHRREIGWFESGRQSIGHQNKGQDGLTGWRGVALFSTSKISKFLVI